MIKQKSNNYKILAATFFAATGLFIPVSVQAAVDSDTTTINANLGSTISITTSGTVTLNVTPTSTGSMSSASDTVTVATNTTSGYALTLADSDANTDLVDGSNTIAAHAGSQGTPSGLADNTWGYRVDSTGGFGAGPTSSESNEASSAYTWAGVPASGSANTIKTTASQSAGDATTVWYGILVDTATPSGTYSDTVTYTATTNP